MYKHILIALDGSELSERALKDGLRLAHQLGAQCLALTVSEPWNALVAGEAAIAFPYEQYEKAIESDAKATLDKAKLAAAENKVACEVLHVRDRLAFEGILETAEKKNCDLIVMGSHGRRGLNRLLLGSQTNNVIIRSKIPVLVCKYS